jgi:hypothetical protein
MGDGRIFAGRDAGGNACAGKQRQHAGFDEYDEVEEEEQEGLGCFERLEHGEQRFVGGEDEQVEEQEGWGCQRGGSGCSSDAGQEQRSGQ